MTTNVDRLCLIYSFRYRKYKNIDMTTPPPSHCKSTYQYSMSFTFVGPQFWNYDFVNVANSFDSGVGFFVICHLNLAKLTIFTLTRNLQKSETDKQNIFVTLSINNFG